MSKPFLLLISCLTSLSVFSQKGTLAIPGLSTATDIGVFIEVRGNFGFSEVSTMKLKNIYIINRENHAEIHWIVSDEKPNVLYTVERSVEKGNFNPISQITATRKTEYIFTDPDPLHGFTVYRLKVNNINRAFYSKMVSVGGDEDDVLVTCYPTPVTGPLNVEIYSAKQDVADVAIINGAGNTVLKKHQGLNKDRTIIKFDLAKFPSGLYTVKVTLPENRIVVQPFTKN